MTLKDLTEIEARVNRATPGPWDYCAGVVTTTQVFPAIVVGWAEKLKSFASCAIRWTAKDGERKCKHDGEFIAHSRTDVPALCAALREEWNRNTVEDGVDALGRERGDHAETIWYLRQARARIAELEEALEQLKGGDKNE